MAMVTVPLARAGQPLQGLWRGAGTVLCFLRLLLRLSLKKTPRGAMSRLADRATRASTSYSPQQALLGPAVGFLSYQGKNVTKKSRREGDICWLWGEEALFSVKISNHLALLLFSLDSVSLPVTSQSGHTRSPDAMKKGTDVPGSSGQTGFAVDFGNRWRVWRSPPCQRFQGLQARRRRGQGERRGWGEEDEEQGPARRCGGVE